MPRKLYFIDSIHTSPITDEKEVEVTMIGTEGEEDGRPDTFTFTAQQFRLEDKGEIREGQYVYYDDRKSKGEAAFTDGTYSLYAQREIARSNYYRSRLLDAAQHRLIEHSWNEESLLSEPDLVKSFHVNVGHGNCSLIFIKKGSGYQLWMVDCSISEYPNKATNEWQYHSAQFEKCLDHIANLANVKRDNLTIHRFFLTHMHYDHYNGIEYLINQNLIKAFTACYINLHYQVASKPLNDIWQLMDKNGIYTVIEPISGNADDHAKILHPECRVYASLDTRMLLADKCRYVSRINDSSVVYCFHIADKTMAFPGDLERKGYQNMFQAKAWGLVFPLNYCAVSHHGSLTGHPDITTLSREDFWSLFRNVRRNTKVAILMGRNGAYNGIYSKNVMHTYSKLLLDELYLVEKNIFGYTLSYLELDWLTGKTFNSI